MDPKTQTEVSEAHFLLAACRAELVRVRDGGMVNPDTAVRLIREIEALLPKPAKPRDWETACAGVAGKPQNRGTRRA